jgi:hypothetical protein
MTLQHHRPDGKGGLEERTVSDANWRKELRSPRWGSSLRGGRLPELRNTEMRPTSTLRALLLWGALGVLTFVVIVVGYGTGFWG